MPRLISLVVVLAAVGGAGVALAGTVEVVVRLASRLPDAHLVAS